MMRGQGVSRRAILSAVATVPLAGCGFQPVYMRAASGKPGPAQRELQTIHVNLIPERPGQLLRQALQQRLHGTEESGNWDYDLGVIFWITGEGIAVLPDTTSTSTRMTAHASWVLLARDAAHTPVTSGSARALESYNTFDSQYFNNDLENQQVTRQLADQVADQITLRLATFFRARAGGVA